MKNAEQLLTTKELDTIDEQHPNAIFSRKDALLMLRQGYTYQVVADTLGVAKSSINEACKSLLPNMDKANAMRALKEDFLLEGTHDIFTAMKKMLNGEYLMDGEGKPIIPLKDLTNTLAILIDKYQLITGKATSNAKATIYTGKLEDNIIDIDNLNEAVEVNAD